jgi:hypothetical protein
VDQSEKRSISVSEQVHQALRSYSEQSGVPMSRVVRYLVEDSTPPLPGSESSLTSGVKRRRVNLRLPESLHRELKTYARKRGVSMCSLMEEIIRDSTPPLKEES